MSERGFGTVQEQFISDPSVAISVGTYLQSWKYFQDVRPELLQIFQFKDSISARAKKWLRSLPEKNNVCVHLRFGDHVKYKYLRMPPVKTLSKVFSNYSDDTVIVVISDNGKRAMEYLSGVSFHRRVLSPFKDPSLDMALLYSCDTVVASRGTFAWWPIWMKGRGLHYTKEFDTNHKIVKGKWKADEYYPPFSVGYSD